MSSVLYLRNIPEGVHERLAVLAARNGMSVSSFVTNELVAIARRADNAYLLDGLVDIGIVPDVVVSDIESGRSER